MKNLSFLPLLFAAASLLILSGCYTVRQGVSLLGYLSRAVPLEKAGNEEFVRLANDIRSFAMEELGLSQSKNYTTYVEINRDYLAAVVSASAKDSFQDYEWNYPIVGRMPYKGFFKIEDAYKEREKLEKNDLDVWIRGVDAFSTLGWFKDPLYSYMSDYSPYRLAELIIHELVHSTVFIKGQTGFNEELAEFIGSEGSRLYMESRYGTDSEEYREMQESQEDSRNYVLFLQELIAKLDAIYSRADLGREEKLTLKELIIREAKIKFEEEYEQRFTGDNYRGFLQMPVNNAYLGLFRLYYSQENYFYNLFENSGRPLKEFIEAAKTVTRRGGDPREQLENALIHL